MTELISDPQRRQTDDRDRHPQDLQSRTMTLEAGVRRHAGAGLQLWADPRQLERRWGPSTYPATVGFYDLCPGGQVEYHIFRAEPSITRSSGSCSTVMTTSTVGHDLAGAVLLEG
jgi:hypothetical protein